MTSVDLERCSSTLNGAVTLPGRVKEQMHQTPCQVGRLESFSGCSLQQAKIKPVWLPFWGPLAFLPAWFEVFDTASLWLLFCCPPGILGVIGPPEVSPEKVSDTLVTAVTGRCGIRELTAGACASGGTFGWWRGEAGSGASLAGPEIQKQSKQGDSVRMQCLNELYTHCKTMRLIVFLKILFPLPEKLLCVVLRRMFIFPYSNAIFESLWEMTVK